MQWPPCPCCGRAHWPRYAIYGHAPTVRIAKTLNAEPLVLAIAQTVGPLDDHKFFVWELMDNAKRVEGPLRSAIGNMSDNQLGKMLRKIQGKEFNGYRIERLRTVGHVALWRLFVLGE